MCAWPRVRCKVLWSARVGLSVCLSVCPLACRENACPHFTKCSVHVTCGRGSISLWRECNTLANVFRVLWMTLRFRIKGQVQIQALSPRRRESFTVTRQVAPLNGAPGTKSSIVDCVVISCCFIDQFVVQVELSFQCVWVRVYVDNWPRYLA